MAHGQFKSSASPDKALEPKLILAALNCVDRLTRLDGWLGALCLVGLTAFMVVGMTIRLLAGFVMWLPPDLPIAWEYSSYLMAATFTFGAAMTLRCGGHIRVRMVLSRLDGQARRGVEIFASLAAFAFFCFFTWALLHLTMSSYQLNERSIASDTPLWIPQAVVTFGVLLMCLQFLARVVRSLIGMPLEQPAFKNVAALSAKA
jgi:TRAP-type C4-dicarboxylate transport system permease small subunit